ncbi:FAD-binding oxidoreductase, partial [Streptomyces albus]
MTLLEALGSQIDADRLITDPDIMASYIHDDAEWAPYEMPVAVVRPRTAEQVQTVVQACIAHGAP